MKYFFKIIIIILVLVFVILLVGLVKQNFINKEKSENINMVLDKVGVRSIDSNKYSEDNHVEPELEERYNKNNNSLSFDSETLGESFGPEVYDDETGEFFTVSLPADFNAYSAKKQYDVVMSDDFKALPNFNNKYTIITWDCGIRCQKSIIVDKKNKKVYYDHGQVIKSSLGLKYSIASNLIIVNTPEDVFYAYGSDFKKIPSDIKTKYYLFKDGKLELAKEVRTTYQAMSVNEDEYKKYVNCKESNNNIDCLENIKYNYVNDLPKFIDYPAHNISGLNVPPDFNKYPKAKEFYTVINRACKKSPNFNKTYTIATWGCGTGCQTSVIINRRSGKIYYDRNFWIGSTQSLTYDVNSNLIIVNPPEKDPFSSFCLDPVTRYYIFKNGELKLIREELLTIKQIFDE